MRFFNTAGPVNPVDHYCIPPLERLNFEDILTLIEQKKYFVLHAPRQTGKTSCLLALMEYLNRQGKHHCLYFNVEAAQAAREDVAQGMDNILRELASRAKIQLADPFPESLLPQLLKDRAYGTALNQCLTNWAVHQSKPLVLLMDEVDSLIGDTLISVLRQLRSGYDKRPQSFPQSIILCGVRDIRDYRIHSDLEKAIITGGSAFNIKAESLRLRDFNREEMLILLNEHTIETSQEFEKEAASLIWEFTQGQPWLVNALAYEVCFRIKKGRDRKDPIQPDMVIQARENLIERRETHLDQLVDKLGEERVRSVIEPVLSGKAMTQPAMPDDDLQYVEDLGLIRRKPQVAVANPIYQEIIPRMLTSTTQDTLPFQTAWYVLPDGRLNMETLLSAFQEFFRENSEHWLERFQYKEAGPQLLLQAFLQRVINSGGRIEREYALGRMRTDLLIFWPTGAETADKSAAGNGRIHLQKIVIELKVLYKNLAKTIDDGLDQTFEYMVRCNADEAHLVIFDRDPQRSWDEKVFMRDMEIKDRKIRVWGV